MPSTTIERIDRLLSGESRHPFDFVNNPVFYDPQPEPGTDYTARLLAQTKMAYVAANAVSRGLEFSFVPGSMSNGWLAYRLAADFSEKILANTEARTGAAYLTTQRLKHNVPSSELRDRVILPSRIQNQQFVDGVERKNPDMAVIGPVDFEGPLRVVNSSNALSQGATFQDWTYEHWWGPRVVDTSGMELRGDHAYSRYAHVEETLGDLIQCGLLDEYRTHVGPGKTYDITDEKGRQVSLADRAWETAKHIVDVVERGFRSDLAVAALAVKFQIDDWLNDPANSPLDMSKVHPVLARRSKEDHERMARLKEIMLPYLAAKCAPWMPYDQDKDLKAYFEKNVLPAAGDFNAKKVASIKRELFAYHPRGGFVHPENGPGHDARPHKSEKKAKAADSLSHNFSLVDRAVKRRSTDGPYFGKPAKIFDDHHFAKLDTWEQAALSFIVGATEGHRLPENAPRSFFYVCEPKGGERAADWAALRGIDWLKEAQSAGDQLDDQNNFYRDVIQPNTAQAAKIQETLADEKGVKARHAQNIVSTLDFLEIDEAVQHYREFVAAKGPQRLSSEARLALEMEWLDRNAEGVVLRKGWENHPAEVQLMLRAVLIATGQVERYEGGKYRMEIFVHDPDAKKPADRLQKQDLHDLVKTLGEKVEKWLDRSPPVPARHEYLACARLLEIVDKLADPGRLNYEYKQDPDTGRISKTSNEIVSWNLVDRDLFSFWYENPAQRAELTATQAGQDETFRDRLRGKLLAVGVQDFTAEDLNGLNEDYRAAWHKAHSDDAYEKRPDRPDGRFLDFRGPT